MGRVWLFGVLPEHFEEVGREGETERPQSPAQRLLECNDAGKRSEGVN